MDTLIPEQQAHIDAGRHVVEQEWPDGSGGWGYTDDLAHAMREADRYARNGCRVWVDGVEVA